MARTEADADRACANLPLRERIKAELISNGLDISQTPGCLLERSRKNRKNQSTLIAVFHRNSHNGYSDFLIDFDVLA